MILPFSLSTKLEEADIALTDAGETMSSIFNTVQLTGPLALNRLISELSDALETVTRAQKLLAGAASILLGKDNQP